MNFITLFRSTVSTMEAMTHEDAVGRQVAERYMLDELAGADREAFEAHFFSCDECAEDLRAVEAFTANARAVLAEELRSQPLVAAPPRDTVWATVREWLGSWSSWQMSAAPAFASAALVALLGYQGLVQLPALRADLERMQVPQALATAILHTATRGDGTIVRLTGNETFAQLTFDVSAAAPVNGAYICRLVSAAGSEVFALRVTPPLPGLPVNLLVPASLLQPGRYSLNVSLVGALPSDPTAGNARENRSATEIDSYDFVVQRQ